MGVVNIILRYISNRYIQSMGAFGFASQMYRIALRFYVGCNKEVGVVCDIINEHDYFIDV